MRKHFANICKNIVTTDNTSTILLGDISHYLLKETEALAPNRFYNIGICEQSMVSLASGMAIEGLKPILHTISPFLLERAFEQIKVDIGYQNLEVTLVTVGGTFDYSDLGCTHHCYGDIALMRLIPEMQIFIPGNEKELESLFLENWGNGKPKYFRLSSKSHNQNIKIKTGDITLVRNSNNNKFVFVTGHLLDDVIEIPNVGILYVPTLSKINSQSVEEINKLLNPKSKLYTVENHSKNGGLGDLISQNFNLPVTRIGLDNKFITEYGSIDELREVSGISKTQIFEKINE